MRQMRNLGVGYLSAAVRPNDEITHSYGCSRKISPKPTSASRLKPVRWRRNDQSGVNLSDEEQREYDPRGRQKRKSLYLEDWKTNF